MLSISLRTVGADVSIFLGYDPASLTEFLDNIVVSKRRELITHLRVFIYQKNGNISHFAAETFNLAFLVLCYSGDAIKEGFWCGNVEEGDKLEDLDIDGRILLKSNLKEDGRAWAEVI